ncbi:hypothetical protein [Sphingobacterium daejeonense]
MDFMLKCSKQYNVDSSRFEVTNYFSLEIRSLSWSILNPFFRKEPTSKKA